MCRARIPRGVWQVTPGWRTLRAGLPAAEAQNTHLIIVDVLIFYIPKRMDELQSI